ncbi:putative leucine-rich repeat-containing protein DDB_G0290503 isoform X2 [Wyeomyia smithii]|uniref:putative leucine-rich repeat-containing protein DDB_G0290503 isoform X2 n=1 Tax=Wyeomyia smithii TaxID=174621 RepID=UPI002467CFA0|nr:putative leucine-rich repeat-containing protein DDB_G0290503 isoform X2 [Wyeomyia smithii]
MDGLRWSQVLVQWVTHSKLIDCQFDNIEQCSVEDFYRQFRSRMLPTLSIQEDNIIDFLKKHFPHYELYLNESGQIAAPDRFYIISLLLYFSCVLHPDSFFQQICNNFDKLQQIAVGAFLKSMLDGSQQRKDIDRMMIQRAIQDAMPHTMLPPVSIKVEPHQQAPSQSQSSQSSQLSLPSRITSADLLDSPLRLNSRVPRLSPPTPKTVILDERTKQLKELKAQLEAERYEKGYLEMQLKQLQDKNERFMEDKRKHLKEIRELKAELQSGDRENESPNKQRADGDHKLVRIQRLLAEKEDTVDRLKIELETISENNKHATEMINYRNTQIAKLNNKILELEGSIVTLSECIEEKEEVIKCLRENNEDLQNFIKENRSQRDGGALAENLNTSFECLDLSAVASSTGTSGGTGPSPENMACAVVDVQLKEKEVENGLLKRSLEMYEQEKVRISGLVGQFFRLYDDIVGKLPGGKTALGSLGEVGFVEKMNLFKTCYEALFEEYAKASQAKEMMEEKNDTLEEDVRQLKEEVMAKEQVLRDLEVRSAEIERELEALRKSTYEYQHENAALNECVVKQKRDFLKLISEKDALSKQNLNLNVEYNSLKEEYESILQKVDYLMVALNEDYEDGDYSSWFEKMEDLTTRLGTLKEDKDRMAALNMKITVETIALQKEISNGEDQRKCLQEQHAQAESRIRLLQEEVEQTKSELNEQNQKACLIEKEKINLQEMMNILREELEQTQSSLQSTLKELEATEQSLESNRQEVLSSKNELADEKKRNSVLTSDLEKQTALKQTFENQLQTVIAEKCQLESKLAELESELQIQINLLEEAQQKSNECDKRNDLLKDNIRNLQEKNKTLEETIAQQRDLSEYNLEQIEKLTLNVRELEDLLQDVTEQGKSLERNLDDRHEQDQLSLRDSAKEKEILTSANRSLLSGLTLIQNGIESLESQYTIKICTLQQKLAQFATLLSKLSTQQCRMRLEKTSMEEVLVRITDELQALQTENQRLTKEKESVCEEVIRVQKEKTAVEDRNSQLASDMSELNVTLQLEQTKVKELSSQVQSLTTEKNKLLDQSSLTEADLQKQLCDATAVSKQLQTEVRRVESAMAELEKQLKEKAEQAGLLSNELDEKEVRCTRLEVELKEMHVNLKNQKQLTAQQLELKSSLEDELRIAREDLSGLEAKNRRLDFELSDKLAEIDRQAGTVSRLRHDKELLEEKVQELATVLGAVRQSKAAVSEELEQEREKSDELESQFAAISEKLAEVGTELDLLQSQLDTVLAERDQLVMEKQELNQQVEELRESNSTLEEDRDTLREEKCRLAAEVDKIDSDKEAIGEQCTKLLTELAKVRETSKDSNNEHEARINELTEQLALLKEKLKVSSEANREKVKELEQTKQLLENASCDKTELETKLSEISRAMAALQLEKSQLENEQLIIIAKLEAQKLSIEQLNEDKQSLSETNENLAMQITSKETIINEMDRKIENLIKTTESTSKQIETLEEQKAALLEKMSVQKTNLSEKMTLIANLQGSLTDVNETLKQKCLELEVLSKQLEESEMRARRVKEENESMNLRNLASTEKLTNNHKEVLDKLENAQQRNNTQECKIQELTKELEIFLNEVASSQRRVESKDEENRTLKEALDVSKTECAELASKIEELNDEKTSLESALIEIRNELEVCATALANKQTKIEELTNCLSDSTATNQSLQKKSEELQAIRNSLEIQLQTLTEQVDNSKSENETLKATIANRDNEIHQLTEGLSQVKEFQSKLENKVTEYETTIAEKDKLEAKLKQLQDEENSLKEEKTDIERRLIQQLQEYDTLNEVYLKERDANKTMKLHQEEQDRKIRILTEEHSHLKLTHEGVKSQLSLKEKQLSDKDKQMDRLKQEIDELFGKNRQVDTLSHEMMTLKMQKSELEAKRDELQDTIQHHEVQERTMQENLQQLRNSLRTKQHEMDSLHSELTSLKDAARVLKIENGKLKSNHDLQSTKLLNLELKNEEQSKKIEQLEQSLSKTEISHLEDNSKVSVLLKKLEAYKQYEVQLRKLEELHQKEREINEKGQLDIDILRAKLIKNRKITEDKEQQWNHEREALMAKLADNSKTSDEKIHEIRTDYESKLEKLKEKMAVLYNENLQKATAKHETDLKELKAQLSQEMKKFNQLETHNAKVQEQLEKLNQRNLDLRREHESLKSKHRILEDLYKERRSMLPPPMASGRGFSSLKMEDEQGEIFNNTYLTDLKQGRMSPPCGRESVPMSVLNQRNSMVPPHLKCSYTVQYNDGDATDEENRDTAFGGLDDSSASLISRKKTGGTTTYRRPGPPTPSKKGGRLSFGGTVPTNDFQYKEICKENANSGGSTIGSRLSFGGRKSNVDSGMAELNARHKTPGKFSKMFSSSNLLNQLSKDENSVPRRRLSLFNKK